MERRQDKMDNASSLRLLDGLSAIPRTLFSISAVLDEESSYPTAKKFAIFVLFLQQIVVSTK